ncbi:hypothetical protein PUNSTDRAFT_95125 [Punctularia strigosozonata HHB-11173 SS5]|uniref:uncharacterized protein n=1 Tax=Punctularia strigosozonata (strain HHB-11173) TaxID=741275 RepID=UPI000441788C|nr:uncharacterized protein PUNSTDRAFT_95125 [Punctularia strigosozonata HHB-11173 SS5]EIN13799.1 hypothetical protein PUNSTDRAFT_95125 [Punctularia strigosozonata HHB-11173 SS5]
MANHDPWWDFETLRHNIKQNTVDRLKHIISGLNDECSTNISKTGKKQELIDRINGALDGWRQASHTEKWTKAKSVLYQVRNSGTYTANKMSSEGTPTYSSTYPVAGSSKLHSTTPTAVSSIGRYDTATPRKPVASLPTTVSRPQIRFQTSPFLRAEQVVSTVVECPESSSAMDRRQQSLVFSLTQDQIAKLNSTSPKYQLRLYCTSNTYYTPGQWSGSLCPIEFPPTCEVRVNNVQLSANLKGLKKRPGTAPPADLGKSIRQVGQNRVEMVYVNSQQGTPAKKYYMVVQLAEVTTVEQLVDRVKKGKYKSKDEILATMKAAAAQEDDDIVAGPQKMSLKDALTFVRVGDPCRAASCPHPQCFDATTWFTVMEQTTTWLCPVCERVLDPKDLIIDGYFEDILKQTPESLEDVMVEADGEWHSQDNRYASPGWKASHPYIPPPPTPSTQRRPSPKLSPRVDAEKKKKPNGDAILVLDDSDEEDEGRVKRELSPTNPLSAENSLDGTLPPQSQLSRAASTVIESDVIDLTVDDEDEPVVRSVAGRKPEKRKAPDTGTHSEHVWKKSRTDSIRPNGHANGTQPATPSIPVYSSAPYTYPPQSARPSASRTPSGSGPNVYASNVTSQFYSTTTGYPANRDGYHSQNRTNGSSRW